MLARLPRRVAVSFGQRHLHVVSRPAEADLLPAQLRADTLAPAALPVVDLDAADASAKICEACSCLGFFQVVNHGVPRETILDAERATRAVFALPLEDKAGAMAAGTARVHPTTSRGYTMLRGETLDLQAPPDMKEFIDLGPERPALDDPTSCPFTGPNVWPDESVLPERIFRNPVLTYMDSMNVLARKLLQEMARGLKLPGGPLAFDPYFQDPVVIHRLLHYPEQKVTDLAGEGIPELGCGAHTDYGALTILRQMDEPGLQVRHAQSGEWIWAPIIPDSFTINIGDCMQHWTAGRFQSTLHRVINVTGRDRHSMAFFFDPDYDVLVNPAGLLGETAAEKCGEYQPFVAGHHKLAKYEAVWQTDYSGDEELKLGSGSDLFKQ